MKTSQKYLPQGFALIATISVLSLLVMVALGMLSLSTVTTRTTEREIPMQQAKANARMALMIALGELQKMAGPDTRVTAPADAVAGSTSAPRQLTGVWRSWEGSDHTNLGKPIAPTYENKTVRGDASLTGAAAAAGGRFLGWLVSSNDSSIHGAENAPSVAEVLGSIPLVGEGSVSVSSEEVHVVPVSILDSNDESSGAYAWWVQGQNTKALVKYDEIDPVSLSVEESSDRVASFSIPYRQDFGVANDESLEKVVSSQSLELLNYNGESFHDLTTYSTGLLTNVATGGWKRDLSLMSENWNGVNAALNVLNISTDEFLSSGQRSKYYGVDVNGSGADLAAAIYGWAGDWQQCLSWQALVEFATVYRHVSHSGGFPILDVQEYSLGDGFVHDVLPANFQVQFAYYANADGRPALLYKPIFTYWNPYNVGLANLPPKLVHFGTDFPIDITYEIADASGVLATDVKSIGEVIGLRSSGRMRTTLDPQEIDPIWKPGETRVFSDNGHRTSGVDFANATTYQQLESGYHTDGGYYKANGLTNQNYGANNPGSTLQLSWAINSNSKKFGFVNYPSRSSAQYVNKTISYSATPHNDGQFYEFVDSGITQGDGPVVPLSDLDGSEVVPFIALTMRLRHLDETNVRPKGYLNTKQIHGVYGFGPIDSSFDESSYELDFDALSSWLDPNVNSPIELANGVASNYIGTSSRPETGLPNWVVSEIPTRPLRSILELQHFDIGLNNLTPPRTANPIGNSTASYQIPSDDIENSSGGLDHSYISNHLFLDDWFVSSIAPQYSSYGVGQQLKDQESVFRDFLSAEGELINKSYKPRTIYNSSSSEEIDDEVALLTSSDGWREVASRINVEGMFNINSTSVDAWAAILKSQRSTMIPIVDDNLLASSATTVQEAATGTPVSRFTLAGDPNVSGNDADYLNSFMDFSDDHIDTLAEYIVEEVKARGPFLSLSEFFNRKLAGSSDEHSLSGAVESALYNLSNDADSPYADIKSAFSNTSEVSVLPNDSYSQATVGASVYGTPGWARQADILRPLAPVLSARDDTFIIRAYGESDDGSSKAWCEAVVTRSARFVDPSDSDATDYVNLSDINKVSGRKFGIVSFKWLNPEEV